MYPWIYEAIVSGPTGGLMDSKEPLGKVKGLANPVVIGM